MILFKGLSIIVYASSDHQRLLDFLTSINVITNTIILPLLPNRELIIHHMKATNIWWEGVIRVSSDPKLWGPCVWGMLYNLAYMKPPNCLFTSMILKFQYLVPCGKCNKHFKEILLRVPYLKNRSPIAQVDLLRELVDYKKRAQIS